MDVHKISLNLVQNYYQKKKQQNSKNFNENFA